MGQSHAMIILCWLLLKTHTLKIYNAHNVKCQNFKLSELRTWLSNKIGDVATYPCLYSNLLHAYPEEKKERDSQTEPGEILIREPYFVYYAFSLTLTLRQISPKLSEGYFQKR